MKLPRYPKYKGSGVKWLGQVPEHWEVRPLKRALAEPLMYGANESADDDTPGNPRYVRITDIDSSGELREDTFKSLPANVAKPYLLHAGDILLARSGATVGKSFIYRDSWGECCFAGYLIKAHLKRQSALPAFVYSYFQSSIYWEFISSEQIQATIQNVSAERYATLPICFPPFGEQLKIDQFLTDQVGKINRLIREQQSLIELLQEKRQAIIINAVTKGLHPDAPMKSSGIDRIDAVPSNWRILKLKFLIKKIEQGWSPQCENVPAEEDEWSVLKVGCVNGGWFNPRENKKLPQTLEPESRLGIRKGDVLISRANTRELVGSAAVALASYPKHMLCDKLYRLTVGRDECDPHYVALFLSTPSARSEIELSATGASQSMVNIAQSVITNMVLPVPPLDEQKKIGQYISDENRKLENFIDKAFQAVALLQERRSALITAAVTGQIDVRNYRPEEAAAVCQ